MANGSHQFWDDLVVSWTYDDAKQILTVSAALHGKLIGTTQLNPTNHTGQLQGSDAGETATVDLGASFSSRVLTMNASEQNPTRSNVGQGNF